MRKIFLFVLLVYAKLSYGQILKTNEHYKSCEFNYPLKALEKNIEGTVKVKVVFDRNCKPKKFIVTKSIGFGCDEAALNMIRCRAETGKLEVLTQCKGGYSKTFPVGFKFVKNFNIPREPGSLLE